MELAGRSLKGQLGHADALGARYVAIVEDGETVLKDMQDGGQERIATDTVVHAVLARPAHALSARLRAPAARALNSDLAAGLSRPKRDRAVQLSAREMPKEGQ